MTIHKRSSNILLILMLFIVFFGATLSEPRDVVEAEIGRRCLRQKSARNSFFLKIFVLTYKRADSLTRLFNSLLAADYIDDCIDLEIFIDYSEHSTDNEPVIKLSEDFKWPYGTKRIHERIVNVGVIGQWIEAWNPSNENEYGLFLEDDMEVSPVFYRWLKYAVKRFNIPLRFDNKNSTEMAFGPKILLNNEKEQHLERIFGISLQRLLIISANKGPTGRIPIENGNMPFAYQLTGTWGQLYFPGPWRDFRSWFRKHRHQKGFKPMVDGLINTYWYSVNGDTAWEQWVIRWAHDTGRFCIYSNLPGNNCFATNHRELGNHYHEKLGIDCSIVKRKSREIFNFPQQLQFYNFSLLPVDPSFMTPLVS